MNKGIFTMVFCLVAGYVFGQSDGDYRTRASGNWSQANRWDVFYQGAWRVLNNGSAGPFQNVLPTSASGTITIRATHSIRVAVSTNANQLVIENGGILRIVGSRTLTIIDDLSVTPLLINVGGLVQVAGTLDLETQMSVTPIQVNGTLENSSLVKSSNGSLLIFNAGSVYRHSNTSGGAIPTATWSLTSTCLISGFNGTSPPTNLGQSFGNFTWNTPTFNRANGISLAGGLQTVNGNLTFISTGSTPRQVRLDNGGAGYNLSIGGNFVIQGGLVTLTQSQTTSTAVTIGGNLNISGGTLTLGITNNSAVDVLLNGNFQKTGGLIVRGTGSGSATIRFAGGLQTYENDAAITSAVNFSVESGSNLNLSTQSLTGTGTFTLNTGGTLQVGSVDLGGAIQVGTGGGNIQVAGVRTYQTNSDIIYNGAGVQYMASGHPAAPNTTINNIDNVFLLSNITTNGELNLVEGILGLENFTLTIAGIYDRTNGFIGIIPGSSIDIEGTGAFDDLILYDYFGGGSMNNFTINRAGITVIQGLTSLTVNGSFSLLAGNYSLNDFFQTSLTLSSAFSQAVGTSIIGGDDNNDSFVVAGTGALPAAVNLSGTLRTLRMNRTAGLLTMGSAVNVITLNLRDGIVAPSNLITMATGGRVIREFGTINAALLAESSYDVEYAGAFDVTTALELPTNNTQLDSLILNNPFNVTNPQGGPPHTLTLATPVFVNGSLVITEGTLATGNNAINIKRDFVVAANGVFQAEQGTVTFDGGDPQSIATIAPLTLFNVAVNQSPVSSLNITSPVDIENQIAVNSASAVSAGTNLLRLLSTPTRTANVAPLLSGGGIVGSVIVQRHLPKGNAIQSFFYLASPVTNSTVADWRVELPIPNLYRWNEPTRRYVQYSLAGALPSGLGLSVNVNSTATFTTDVRGTLRQGPVSVNVTSQNPDPLSDDGWNLVGNPYPSAIDWDNITLPAGIENAVYITDNFNNSGQGSGIQRVSYVDGVGTPGGYDGRIAQGQAFWIKATANTALNFTESAKSPTTDTQFYREAEVPNVLRIVMEGAGLNDENVIRIKDGASAKFDGKYDARKFFEGEFKLSTLTSDNVKTAINALGTSDCGTPVPLVLEGTSVGEYQFNFNGIESFEGDIGIVLEDLLENKTISVGKERSYAFSITDGDIESLSSRFRITISAPNVNTLVKATGESLCQDKTTAVITIKDSEEGVQYSATWKGEKLSGTEIGTGSTIQLSVNTNTLSFGENEITVWATSGLCSQAALIESPVISKIKKDEISSVLDGVICTEGTTTLVVTGAAEGGFYNWYEDLASDAPIAGQQSAQFTTPVLTKTKTYYVAAVNSLGCESERVGVKAVVSYPDNVTLTVVDNITLKSDHKTGNQWYLNDVLLDDETSDVLHAMEPGVYTLTVDQGGCLVSASREISEIAFEGGTNLESVIKIYPNPTQNKVYVQVRSKNENVKAVILAPTGMEMDSKNLTGENEIKEAEFDLNEYATGIYNVRIIDGSKQSIKKIAKVN
jgi:hypothetical protein